MTHYNDEARGALNVETATKEALNNALLNPLSASVLKNISRADLVAMIETPIPEPAGYSASEKQVEAKVRTLKQVKVPRPAKARAPFMRKARREAKTVKAGTRRAAIMQALLKGATYDDISKLCIKDSGEAWTKAATRSACTTWPCSLGYGIEERDGVFHLIMPRGMDSPIS